MTEQRPAAPRVTLAQNIQVAPNDDFGRYMQHNAECMNSISRHLLTSEVISGIHNFNGNNGNSYKAWMKQLNRASLEKQPVDDEYMRHLISRTISGIAADFWADTRRARPNITWEDIQLVFNERFGNFAISQMALQKLPNLKQEQRETLHAFAQRIIETAREAYNEVDYGNNVVTQQLKNIFINGLNCKETSQILIRENVTDLNTALRSAIREDELQQTYKIRQVDTRDIQGRKLEAMDIDAIKSSGIENRLETLTANVAAMAVQLKQSNKQSNRDTQKTIAKTPTYANYNGNNYNKQYNNSYSSHRLGQTQPLTHNQTNLYQNNPRQSYHGYVNQKSVYRNNNTQYQQNNNRLCNTTRRNYQRNTNYSQITCSHCRKIGHTKERCYFLHPELRSNYTQYMTGN